MRSLLTFVFLAVVLSACSSTPKTSYYTLSAAPIPSSLATSGGTRVMVGPVSLPELIDQPQLVVQNSSNQVSVYEYHRWAGSLKGHIGRVIAANLAQELDTSRVWNYSQSMQTQFDYQVLVDVQSFEAKLGESVVLDVLWTIKPAQIKTDDVATSKASNKASGAASRKSENTAPSPVVRASDNVTSRSGRSLVREPVSGPGFEALVAAQSRALVKVSNDIAMAIR